MAEQPGVQDRRVSTGIPELDLILGGLFWGDNVVWELDGPQAPPFYAAILGYVWVLGRVAYLFGYLQDAKKRSLGFLVSFVAFAVLWGMGLWGIVVQLIR